MSENILERKLQEAANTRNSFFEVINIKNVNEFSYILLNFAVVLALIGVFTNPEIKTLENAFHEFYANVSSELISIVITVLILDRMNQRREAQRQHDENVQRIIREIKSPDAHEGVRAVNEARERGLLDDGTLQGIDLGDGNSKTFIPEVVKFVPSNLGVAHSLGLMKQFEFIPTVTPNLKGVDLTSANLEGTDLSGVNLENALLGDANLRGANLSRANLAGLYLPGANLEEANLSEANLEGAFLQPLTYILMGAVKPAKLRNAKLNKAILVNAYLSSVDFRNVDLSSANLEGADLIGANLEGADLKGANLKGSFLVATQIMDARFDGNTVLPDAVCTGQNDKGNLIYDKYWTPETDMGRFIDPEHPDFWLSELP